MPETQVKSWTPPAGTLGELVAAAYERVAPLRRDVASWRARAEAAAPVRSFRDALRGESVAVIAEVKRRSPSKGVINPGIDASRQAAAYADGGASAVSVLTEPERFGGQVEDLAAVSAAIRIPVLRKDFHVHAVQLYEARAFGASACLLIVRALEPALLRELIAAGTDVSLDLLVEVRDRAELDTALEAGARIIGVNNRNLETLVIDPVTSQRLIPLIPRDIVAIAESGMATRADVQRAAQSGADAVLVGSAISAAADPRGSVANLAGVAGVRGGRPD